LFAPHGDDRKQCLDPQKDVRMASKAQLKANKANASKSTGPRTDTGKASSSRNALTHGLTVEHHFLVGEDPTQFEQLRSAIHSEWPADTELQKQLVYRLATLLWRGRRVPAIESAVFTALAEQAEKAPAEGTSSIHIGQAFERAFDRNIFDKLMRYETGLIKLIRGTLDELRHLSFERAQIAKIAAAAKKEEKPQPPTPNAQQVWSSMKLG
jgi:hypothetical protein